MRTGFVSPVKDHGIAWPNRRMRYHSYCAGISAWIEPCIVDELPWTVFSVIFVHGPPTSGDASR
jgi:hypothetical protein